MPQQVAELPAEVKAQRVTPRGGKRAGGKTPRRNNPRPRNRDRSSKVAAFVIVVLLFYALFTLLIAGFIFYSFNDTAKNTEIYSLRVVYDEKTIHSIPAAEANDQYGLYIPFSYLTDIAAFGLAGEGDDISLFIIGTDNRINCTANSSLIVINDNPVRISAPVMRRESDGEYLIPVTLLETYIKGIDVRYDSEKMICYVSSDVGKTDVALTLLLPEPMEKSYFPESYKVYRPEESTAQ